MIHTTDREDDAVDADNFIAKCNRRIWRLQ